MKSAPKWRQNTTAGCTAGSALMSNSLPSALKAPGVRGSGEGPSCSSVYSKSLGVAALAGVFAGPPTLDERLACFSSESSSPPCDSAICSSDLAGPGPAPTPAACSSEAENMRDMRRTTAFASSPTSSPCATWSAARRVDVGWLVARAGAGGTTHLEEHLLHRRDGDAVGRDADGLGVCVELLEELREGGRRAKRQLVRHFHPHVAERLGLCAGRGSRVRRACAWRVHACAPGTCCLTRAVSLPTLQRSPLTSVRL